MISAGKVLAVCIQRKRLEPIRSRERSFFEQSVRWEFNRCSSGHSRAPEFRQPAVHKYSLRQDILIPCGKKIDKANLRNIPPLGRKTTNLLLSVQPSNWLKTSRREQSTLYIHKLWNSDSPGINNRTYGLECSMTKSRLKRLVHHSFTTHSYV